MEEVISVMPSKRTRDKEFEHNTVHERFRSDKQSPSRSRSVMKGNVVMPFDPDLDVRLKQHGLSYSQIQTEEDQVKVIKVIRAMPRPMHVKKSLKGGIVGNKVAPEQWDYDIPAPQNDIKPDFKVPSPKPVGVPDIIPPVIPSVIVVTGSEKDKEQVEDVGNELEPEKEEFVYRKREKEVETIEELDQYVNRQTNGHHAWTPYLHERKRQMLLAGPIKPTKGFVYSMKAKWRGFKISWNEFKYKMTVWRKSLKKIEGHQGTAVVSYFVFLRWLLFLDIFIFLLLFWVTTFFQVVFDNNGFSSSLVDSTTRQVAAEACSGKYNINATSDALSRILDFIQGTGWMEPTVMFYGAYTNQNLKLAVTDYNMPLAYFVITVIVMLVSLVIMVHNTISNFKDNVLAQEARAKTAYCNSVFASMNYGIMDEEGMNSKQKSIYILLVSELEEQRFDQLSQKRSGWRKCGVYTVRLIINLIIVLMLVGAGAAIYYAQDYSSEFTTKSNIDDYNQFLVLLVEFLPSIVIGALNGIYPLLFQLLVLAENYRPATVVKLTLVRIVFLRLASLIMVVISIFVQITCSDHDQCLVGKNSCPSIQCWETYVGSSLYKLVISDFLVDCVMTLGVELARKCITTRSENCLLQKIGPALFDVPKNVLDLVYLQTLLWLGFFFAPLLPAVVVCSLFIKFYLKKLSALYNTIPPEKPYLASRSNTFFTIILMVAYFMICIPVGYALVELEPSPMCGPFRSYFEPSYIMEIQIDNAPSGFQTVWKVFTTSASVGAIIILLCLALYYCYQLNSAHKELIVMLREQLVLEGKDKQFLLSRVNELAGVGKGNKDKPSKEDSGKKDKTEPKKEKKGTPNGNVVKTTEEQSDVKEAETKQNVPNGNATAEKTELQTDGPEGGTAPANYVEEQSPHTPSPISVKQVDTDNNPDL